MNTKSIITVTLILTFLCGVYSQKLNIDESKNISIKSLTAYNKWRGQNKRNYLNQDEQLYRQLIFIDNLSKIEKHNSDPSNTYTISTNQFSDMTQEEFVSKILNSKVNENNLNHLEEENSISYAGTTTALAASIDWRTKGAVTPVKDQGSCGGCWTFSTTGSMEAYNFIKSGKLTTFSEQQILDCAIASNGFTGKGCDGGNPSIGLAFAQKFGAVESKTYPYVAMQGTCKTPSVTTGYKPTTFSRLYSTEEALKTALNKTVVSVAVDASKWHSYSSGVFNGCSATPSLNHAVLAVGYDVSGNWIVKNSWNVYWGEQGYIRLAPGNTCGILNIPFTITS